MEPIEFIEDIPFPTSNIIVYKEIYYLEQWLRRILRTSLAAKDGEKWFNSIPSEILPELKKKQNMLRGRIYLGSENNSNLLWLLTLEELKRFCLRPEVWPFIKKLTEFNETEFIENMELLREVRNIIGHNRATTEKTVDLCTACMKYFKRGVNIFRDNLCLTVAAAFHYEELEESERYSQTESFKELVKLIPNHTEEWKNTFLVEKEYFREICFSADMADGNVDVFELLKTFKKLESYILAISIFLKYHCYSVIWPKSIPIEQQKDIIRIFVESEHKIMTEKTPYVNQSPRFLGDPMIWFISEDDPYSSDIVSPTLEDFVSGKVIPFPEPS